MRTACAVSRDAVLPVLPSPPQGPQGNLAVHAPTFPSPLGHGYLWEVEQDVLEVVWGQHLHVRLCQDHVLHQIAVSW
jgi:hypothetical protein